ncbi:ABC transporter permease [Haladaptatus sp. CMSO5]|uniref:ABC transporter permease n=1 Tax=Haladaptatus sp. CMSO5 TaxID=3120514 RepID=UPI002FCE36B0
MRPTLVLFRGIFLKSIILLTRYAFNTVSELVTIYLFFALIFFGGQAFIGTAFTDSLEGIIVGFFVFTIAVGAYSSVSWDIIREAQWGTLEQLYMSPFGFGRVTTVKVCVNVLISFLWGGAMLALMLLTTGKTLALDLVTIVPLLILTLASAVGVGFVTGGLALLYKRIENLFAIIQFTFIGLLAAPVDTYPFLKFLPLALGGDLLGAAMAGGVRLWDLPTGDLLLLTANAVGYVVLGYAIFQYISKKARERGVLGHY